MEIKTITAPSLDSAQYGRGIEEAVKNININFAALNNPLFNKGDDAPPVKSAVVSLTELKLSTEVTDSTESNDSIESSIQGIDAKFAAKILDGIKSLLIANGFNMSDQSDEGCTFSKFNMYYNALPVPEPLDDDIFADFFKKYLLSFSPLYVYDKKYYSLNIHNDETLNRSGAYIIQYDGEFTLEELKGYPKLNFIDNKWVWQIDKLKINAQGVNGENGKPGSTYFAVLEKQPITGETNKYKITNINGIDINPNTPIEQYENQVCFTTKSEESNIATLWVGYTSIEELGENKEKTLIFIMESEVSSKFTDENFVECLKHIRPSGETIPGLFIPIDEFNTTEGNPKAHVIHNPGKLGDMTLEITPVAVLDAKKNEFDFKNKLRGNLELNYDTTISGDLKVGENTTITDNDGITIKSADDKKTNINSGGITTSSATIGKNTVINSKGEFSTKHATIGSSTTINPDGITTTSAKIGGNTTINADGVSTKSAKIGGNTTISSTGITTPKVNNLLIGKDSGSTSVISIPALRYGTGSSLKQFYWHVKWYKKNGWVKVIIYAARDEKGTMIKENNWKFFTDSYDNNGPANMEDYWDQRVNNTPFSGLPKPMIPEGEDVKTFTETFTFMDFIGGPIDREVNKLNWIQWGLKYKDGGFNLIPMRGNIHNLNPNGGTNNLTDGKSKYYPYLEFTYPTDD